MTFNQICLIFCALDKLYHLKITLVIFLILAIILNLTAAFVFLVTYFFIHSLILWTVPEYMDKEKQLLIDSFYDED